MKHSNKLKNEIKKINNGYSIKVRMRKTKAGYSLYFDLYSHGIRQREWLKVKLSGKKSDWKSDKDKLTYTRTLRDKKEQRLIQDAEGFKLSKLSKKIHLIDYFKKIAEEKNASTKSRWLTTIKHFRNFLKENKYSEFLTLANAENEKKLSKDFANYLENLNSIQNITAHNYFKTYSALFNQAIRDGLIKINPAKHISIEYEKKKKEYLTLQELETLEKTKCPRKQIKNAFLFSCYTGLRLSDIHNLKFSDIQENENNLKITIKMQKTKKYVSVPLVKKAQAIINKQRKTQRENKVFNIPEKTWLGSKIKIWVALAGIDKHITFHNARHTFVTLLISSGVDIYVISKLCGHSSVAITERAYANLIDTKRFNEMEKLENYFKK